MTDPTKDGPKDAPDTDRDPIMGVREGKGPDQYGGSYGGGQSGGGAYANPHDAATGSGSEDGDAGGQSHQGYYGGGQAGTEGAEADDHHAASQRSSPGEPGAGIDDHPSQQRGTAARAAFDAAQKRAAEGEG